MCFCFSFPHPSLSFWPPLPLQLLMLFAEAAVAVPLPLPMLLLGCHCVWCCRVCAPTGCLGLALLRGLSLLAAGSNGSSGGGRAVDVSCQTNTAGQLGFDSGRALRGLMLKTVQTVAAPQNLRFQPLPALTHLLSTHTLMTSLFAQTWTLLPLHFTLHFQKREFSEFTAFCFLRH